MLSFFLVASCGFILAVFVAIVRALLLLGVLNQGAIQNSFVVCAAVSSLG